MPPPECYARIAYVITLLTGRAREWGTAVWDADAPFCHSFAEEMRKVFDRSKHGRKAASEMLLIRQGRRSVSDYTIDFRTLTASSGWNTEPHAVSVLIDSGANWSFINADLAARLHLPRVPLHSPLEAHAITGALLVRITHATPPVDFLISVAHAPKEFPDLSAVPLEYLDLKPVFTEAAFCNLKGRFTSAPILTQPDPAHQFIVEVDASDIGVGAVLSRPSCPAYSHRLTPLHLIQISIYMCVSAGLLETLKLPVPQLVPAGDTHLYEAGSSFTLTCRGSAPLQWILPWRSAGSAGVRVEEQACERGEYSHCSLLEVHNLTHRDTGLYTCNYTHHALHEESTTYVFVKDEQHLFVEWRESDPDVLTVFESEEELLIPCRTTFPNITVTLEGVGLLIHTGLEWGMSWPSPATDGGQEPRLSAEVRETAEWDPRLGFRIRYPPGTYYSLLRCVATVRSRVTEASYIPLRFSTRLEKVRINAERVKLVVGDTLSLNCSAETSYNGRISFTWDYPRKAVNRLRVFKKHRDALATSYQMSSVLIVRNVSMADRGVYTCTAENKHRKQATVKVIVYEHAFLNLSYKGGRVVSALEGTSRVKFGPRVHAVPPPNVLLWYKDGQPIWKNSTCFEPSGYNLIVKHVKQKDAGEFTVLLGHRGRHLLSNLSYTLVVKVKPRISEEGVVKAELQLQLLGGEERLSCTAFGVPTPALTWAWQPCNPDPTLSTCDLYGNPRPVQLYSEDHPPEHSLHPYNRIKSTFTKTEVLKGKNKVISTLVVAEARASGVYSCFAENEVGTHRWNRPFYVSDLPEAFQIQPQRAVEGDDITLTCQATRYLHSALRWSDPQNRTVPERDTTLLSGPHSLSLSLTLRNVSRQKAEGYRCSALNTYTGRVVSRTPVLNIEERMGPWLQQNLTNQDVSSSSTLTLACYAHGAPPPYIRWYKNGIPVLPAPGVTLTEDGLLIIERVQKEDGGLYECLASNHEGEVKTAAVVTVLGESAEPNLEVTVLVCTGVAAIFLWLLLVLFICKLKRPGSADIKAGYLSIVMAPDELGPDEQGAPLPYDGSRWEFPRDRLRLGKTLGHGAFGKVVEASAFGINKLSTCKTVAVKMLKGGATSNECRALMSELKILIHIGHHLNVVNLLGACTKPGGPLMVIVEYCKYGNLSNYLRSKRGDFIFNKSLGGKAVASGSSGELSDLSELMKRRLESVASTGSSTSSGFIEEKSDCDSEEEEEEADDLYRKVLTMENLICYSFQVAKGMEFLASRKCIHRDLAARNILLSENNVVKICDFGLARDIYKDPDYVRKGDARLPLKWMAPEAIFDKTYSTQSDVWSFGVLMWEIFSLGASPYPGVQIDEEFCCRLKEGMRMQAPEYSTSQIYQTMMECWGAEPEQRPTFTELVEKLGDLLQASVQQDGKHYIPISTDQLTNEEVTSHNASLQDAPCGHASPQDAGSTRRVKTMGKGAESVHTLPRPAVDPKAEEAFLHPGLQNHSPPPDYSIVMSYSTPPI
ncbi:vascular endothelial growth factor receptor kdr-like [Megalops cyprinoides]|uniref:vascular endothelial growth factor receptor kdr-like n=1 Tax=Megalops cyprinoides TaxID=118141 RepID=UPI00186512E4|nr:vascular endothelial growth factor receptor kdr-like [Megalops cyprinoides]